MDSLLDAINAVMMPLGRAGFALLSVFSPVVALWIISAVLGVLMLIGWRYTSNQDAIANVRNQISAHLLATRLFRDNLAVTFRSMRMIFWYALCLFGHSIKPMIILMVPFVILIVQVALRYEFRPAEVGKTARMTVTWEKGARYQNVADQLRLPPGLRADPLDPCRAEGLRTADWRIVPEKPGDYVLTFGAGPDEVTMPLVVGEDFRLISPQRGGGFFNRLLYSAQPAIPEKSVIESIAIQYPHRSTPIFGFDVHWLITILVLSIVFALIAKPVLKVQM